MAHTKATSDKIHIATIGAPFGVRGHFRLKVTTERPEDALSYGALQDSHGKAYSFNLTRIENNTTLIVTEPSVKDRTMAEAMRGVKLYVNASSLPEIEDDDTFYESDLIGLKVVDADGAVIGETTNVFNYGASDILEVKTSEGLKQIPLIEDAVIEIDLSKEIVVIHLQFLI